MRDTDLYRQVLGLDKPWTVERVNLDVAGQRVDIWVEHEDGTVWSCPQCGHGLSCRDHAEERVWRHLDTCQFRTRNGDRFIYSITARESKGSDSIEMLKAN
ncbi:MAG: transposase family protein [Gammaproteobacteria bacterium]|nr:transposase family protein [Gammaproteobacteria bacterium]